MIFEFGKSITSEKFLLDGPKDLIELWVFIDFYNLTTRDEL